MPTCSDGADSQHQALNSSDRGSLKEQFQVLALNPVGGTAWKPACNHTPVVPYSNPGFHGCWKHEVELSLILACAFTPLNAWAMWALVRIT
jgi:hypothetical protein